jgi:hypothetical protein
MRYRRPLLEQRLDLSYWLRNGLRQSRKAARILSNTILVLPQLKRSRPENLKLAPYRSEGRGQSEGE